MKNNISIIVLLFALMLFISPITMALNEDILVISFYPEVDIDINVQVNSWSNKTGGTFTLFNNGTFAMDTEIKSNATTDEGDLTLDQDGSPGADNYSIETNGLDTDDYIPSAYGTAFDESLAAEAFKTFDIHLQIGTNITANHSWQTMTIYFRGTIG